MTVEFSPTKQRVLVIGASGLDLVGRLLALPEPGTSSPAEIRSSFGGVARNVAENLAHLGQPVSLITAVGDGHIGQQLLEHTAACGVDVEECLQVANSATASYLAILNQDGQLHFAIDDMRILSALDADYFRQRSSLFRSAGMIFVDANLPAPVLRTIFQQARLANTPVCVDPVSKNLASKLLPHIPRVYMLTANASEAAVLCKEDGPVTMTNGAQDAARHLINRGVEIAVITLAEQGVMYATPETSGHIPAIETAVIDPTGAGDALTATIIYGLMNDIPLDDTIRMGVTAASLTLRHRGTVLPDLSLEKLYN